MKIKLDENLPSVLVTDLQQLGHDVDSVPAERMAGRPDADVWAAAQAAGRFLITQDLDFSDTRKFTPGTHHGILLVRLRAPGRLALAEKVRALFQSEGTEGWSRSFVIATDRKLRVLHPRPAAP
jgi:predicted nuclease of predicted toxin-antitoxin system